MKYVKISQEDLTKVSKLYDGIMSTASSGLFFREGVIFGDEIGRAAKQDGGEYFETAGRMLMDRGWVDEISFNDDTVIVKGSIEALDEADKPNCHRLRGIVRRLYELDREKKMRCMETKCRTMGDEACTFKLEPLEL